MSTIPRRVPRSAEQGVPSLHNGDRMKQPEFHRRYLAYPEDVKFELVGGIVYMASPLRWPHAVYHEELSFLLGLYRRSTPGLELGMDATTILGEESEPQPDLTLRILPEYGGQSGQDEDNYITGPPELLAEIAFSTVSLDMHGKRDDYKQAGVLEYVVLCVEEKELHWFHFPSAAKLKAGKDGVYRSKVFPGLWIDGQALLDRNSPRLTEVLQQGLTSKEHAAFVKKLEAAHRKRTRAGGQPPS